MPLTSINPATGEKIRDYPEAGPGEVDGILTAVHESAGAWRFASFDERAAVLASAAGVLRRRADEFAGLMTDEMGKLLRSAKAEVEKCAWVCEYFAGKGREFLSPVSVETDGAKSYVTYNPLGVVLAVMPWNFPFWQVFRFAAPALMAGNGGVLKHASNVSGCAYGIEEVWREAGAPPDLFRVLPIPGSRVPELIGDPRIAAVTITGSTEAGRSVAEAAGRHIKKSVLELGGSDPYLVLEDADVGAAAETCVTSRLINGGQSCIAAKRFIVVDAVRAEFEERVAAALARVRMGDPRDPETELGPLARRDLRDELNDQVRRAVAAGARLVLGGIVTDGPGAYYPPTLLTDVRPGNPAAVEELFGPVAAILPAADEEEAVHIANDSSFGLGAAVFTRDLARGEKIAAERLDAGHCAVNAFVKSDPRLPFGGVKESGYGRELSWFGIREFVNVKTVYVG